MAVLDLSAYKPVPATLGDANQVANGMQAIQTCINALDNNNFAAGKIFSLDKVMQQAAVDGDVPVWDNTNSKWVPASLMPATSPKPGLYKIWDSVDAAVALPVASITTPTLPTNFKHLLIEFTVENSSGATNFSLRVNGDTGANYNYEYLQGAAAAASASPGAGATSLFLGSSGTAEPGVGTIKLLDYARVTTFVKHFIVQAYCQNDGGGNQKVWALGGMWNSTAIVTSLTFFHGAGNIVAGSRITVYGEA